MIDILKAAIKKKIGMIGKEKKQEKKTNDFKSSKKSALVHMITQHRASNQKSAQAKSATKLEIQTIR